MKLVSYFENENLIFTHHVDYCLNFIVKYYICKNANGLFGLLLPAKHLRQRIAFECDSFLQRNRFHDTFHSKDIPAIYWFMVI